jgi:dTDP-4-amino-4,6-dideoxygalactose transaminase
MAALDVAPVVPFMALGPAHDAVHDEILGAWSRLLRAGAFAGGAEVTAFEREFAACCEVEHCVAVSSGTDALVLALRALGVGPGDRVLVPANTFIATAEAVSLVGAEPALVDCDPRTRTISVAAAAAELEARGGAGIIAVHLYGHPADVAALNGVAARHGAWVVEDAAQAHLARCRGARVGGLGRLACFSFYPSKNLGATGEGGAVTTRDAALAEAVRMLRHHGQRRAHHHERIGCNARMPELTAAALRIKLRRLEAANRARRRLAARYADGLRGAPLQLPFTEPWGEPVWHLYAVEAEGRDAVRAALADAGVQTGVHYPVPIHLQPAYAHLGHRRGAFPAAEASAARVLSLPLFPELRDDQVDRVVAAVHGVLDRRAA